MPRPELPPSVIRYLKGLRARISGVPEDPSSEEPSIHIPSHTGLRMYRERWMNNLQELASERVDEILRLSVPEDEMNSGKAAGARNAMQETIHAAYERKGSDGLLAVLEELKTMKNDFEQKLSRRFNGEGLQSEELITLRKNLSNAYSTMIDFSNHLHQLSTVDHSKSGEIEFG